MTEPVESELGESAESVDNSRCLTTNGDDFVKLMLQLFSVGARTTEGYEFGHRIQETTTGIEFEEVSTPRLLSKKHEGLTLKLFKHEDLTIAEMRVARKGWTLRAYIPPAISLTVDGQVLTSATVGG